ncbi:hypothetical protein VTN77DRAFT_8906 [Rasamsonia byssochlamydoides]|uniref:uncharacterized protein n=1 Tax=Rasamsonia byssochlamydoides TaxID=89139 RepID=UPI003744287F
MNPPDPVVEVDRRENLSEDVDSSRLGRLPVASPSNQSPLNRTVSWSDNYQGQPSSPRAMAASTERQSSAASENTPIISEDHQVTRSNYQSVQSRDNSREPGTSAEGPAQDTQQGAESSRNGNTAGAGSPSTRNGAAPETRTPWHRRLVDKYGALELDNKGSVARDHLALERTFLAWLRTSLAFASIGIAVTQLFRLNGAVPTRHTHSLSTQGSPILPPSQESSSLLELIGVTAATSKNSQLANVGKPLGATFIGIGILILLIGFHRYFESQYWIVRGKFPASRGSVALVTFVAAALIVTSLVVILAVAPSAMEK